MTKWGEFFGVQPSDDGVIIVYYRDSKPVLKYETNVVTWWIIMGLAKDYFQYRWMFGDKKEVFLEQWAYIYDDHLFNGMMDWLSSLKVFPQTDKNRKKFKKLPYYEGEWRDGSKTPLDFTHSDEWHTKCSRVTHLSLKELETPLTPEEKKEMMDLIWWCRRSDPDFCNKR